MKLTESVYLVGGAAYGLSPAGDCNVYLIDGGKELALVDTGSGHGVKKILENVRIDGFDPSNLKSLSSLIATSIISAAHMS